ncbi:hypothetical protein GQ457_04G008140 [Hibiscus cannabinus]
MELSSGFHARSDPHVFSSSGGKAMGKLIEATHEFAGFDISMKPVLDVVEDIFQRATPAAPGALKQVDDATDERALSYSNLDEFMDILSVTINRISCEITYGCRFTPLIHLPKGLHYSNSCLKFCTGRPFETEIRHACQPHPCHAGGCQVHYRIQELPSKYISPQDPELSSANADIPAAVYWTIHTYVRFRELSSLTHNINSIHDDLVEKTQSLSISNVVRLFDATHIDNIKILKARVYSKDGQPPLGMELPREGDSRGQTRFESQYDVIWIPIVDRSTPFDDTHKEEAIRVYTRDDAMLTEGKSHLLVWRRRHGLDPEIHDNCEKPNPRENVRRRNMTTIQLENISHTLSDISLIWFFWARLESRWHSRAQHGVTVQNDLIMQEILTMLGFDGSDRGWAVISRGSDELTRAKADTALKSLEEYAAWATASAEKGFVPALNDYIKSLQTEHHCNRLILPGISAAAIGSINERVACVDCGKPMEALLMLRCCTD